MKTQKLERKPEILRDCNWLDQTCTMGYSAAGTWNNLAYKNDPTTTTAVHVGNNRYFFFNIFAKYLTILALKITLKLFFGII